jgi:hypothetical protein
MTLRPEISARGVSPVLLWQVLRGRGRWTGLFARPRRIAALADRDIVEREHCALTGIPGPD